MVAEECQPRGTTEFAKFVRLTNVYVDCYSPRITGTKMSYFSVDLSGFLCDTLIFLL